MLAFGATPQTLALIGALGLSLYFLGHQNGSAGAEYDCQQGKIDEATAVSLKVEEATKEFNRQEGVSAGRVAQAERSAEAAWRKYRDAVNNLPERACGFTDAERSMLENYRSAP